MDDVLPASATGPLRRRNTRLMVPQMSFCQRELSEETEMGKIPAAAGLLKARSDTIFLWQTDEGRHEGWARFITCGNGLRQRMWLVLHGWTV